MSLVLLLHALPTALAGDVLLLGASYVLRNDLDVTLEAALDAGSGADRAVEALATGGYTWVDHAADAAVAGDARTALVDTPWQAAILQEYTDVAVLDPSSADWTASAAAGAELVGWLEGNGADVFLYMTWGDREGDGTYPDFLAMNAAVEDGYALYRDQMRDAGLSVWVAPVGVAWRLAYEAEADPLAPDALFYRLYASDGAHPSELGSYLAACTMYAALTGLSPVGLPPGDGVPPSSASAVQELAEAAVFGPEGAAWDYPWEASGGGGDTGGGDTGGDDTGGDTGGSGGDDTGGPGDTGGPDDTDPGDTDPGDTDPGDTDPGDTDETGAPDTDDTGAGDTDAPGGKAGDADDAGCGCASTPVDAPWAGGLALVGLAVVARRRRA